MLLLIIHSIYLIFSLIIQKYFIDIFFTVTSRTLIKYHPLPYFAITENHEICVDYLPPGRDVIIEPLLWSVVAGLRLGKIHCLDLIFLNLQVFLETPGFALTKNCITFFLKLSSCKLLLQLFLVNGQRSSLSKMFQENLLKGMYLYSIIFQDFYATCFYENKILVTVYSTYFFVIVVNTSQKSVLRAWKINHEKYVCKKIHALMIIFM